MKLHVFHRTRFDYAAPVWDSFNEVRLEPQTADGQVCHSFLLKVLPAVRLSHFRDFQRNIVHVFDVTEPHQSLTVESNSVVTTVSHALAADLTPAPLDGMEACSREELCHDFLQPSRYVDTDPETWRLGLDITAGTGDAWQAAQAVMAYVNREFTYMPDATNVHTHMREVLPLRRGVCQDFAHVMIGICRTLKIPARYVSGYIYNGPADQLRGAQATHAWAEIYLPKLGWRGLDPTNAVQPDERYVKLAVGRDYADVPPVRGTYRGTTGHRMKVEALVSALEAPGPPLAPSPVSRR
jgi:transglutaminase-like putative cysteine protease